VVVLAGGVCRRKPGFFVIGDADEAKRRVRRGRLQLAFESEQASSDDIRLGDVELVLAGGTKTSGRAAYGSIQ
jgi:hypothetical protein